MKPSEMAAIEREVDPLEFFSWIGTICMGKVIKVVGGFSNLKLV